MYSDAGVIEAQVVSVWQHETCVHEPGFLVATGLDTDEPVYRVLVLAQVRPGTKAIFNQLQQTRLDNDRRFGVVSETESMGASSSSDADMAEEESQGKKTDRFH